MPIYKATAIVLRRIPLGEKDKIVTLFTRERGKLDAVAKGARRPGSKLAGASEPLSLVRALLSDGSSLDVLTQADVHESFARLRGDWGLYLRATYACELLGKVVEERDPAPETFDLLLATLYILQRAEQPDACLHAYELQLLAQIGYEPQLSSCARCDREFDEQTHVAAFSSQRGGALCGPCADSVDDDTIVCDTDTLAWLIRLSVEVDPRTLAKMVLSPEILAATNRILRAHLRFRVEREVKSTAMLDALRLEEAARASSDRPDNPTV